MSKYKRGIADGECIHAVPSNVEIAPACGVKVYTGTLQDIGDVNCPQCLLALAKEHQELHTAATPAECPACQLLAAGNTGPSVAQVQALVYQVNAANGWHEDKGELVTPNHPMAQIVALGPIVLALTDVIEAIRHGTQEDTIQDRLQTLSTAAQDLAQEGLVKAEGTSRDHGRPVMGSATQTITRLMLIVTEASEAILAVDKSDVANFVEEVADIVIRSLDLIGALAALHGPKFNLEAAILAKIEKNKARGYRHGGKRA